MPFLMSTRSPKRRKKSAPIIGCDTAAMMKGQLNSLLSRRSNFNRRLPYVGIAVPFAVNNCICAVCPLVLWAECGTTDISAQMSMRYREDDVLSVKYKR
ncbi:hypothetical protein CEXT_357161 [Caerostris extrusa]|uniref:Uncharacterized protein n=1 Tax=Caerostris extrusa TaxID=172846 RepID=A0AAV4SSG7_CAEEX|nr:hypothetical protein CEXT_357161 [Caerostris extrusa]